MICFPSRALCTGILLAFCVTFNLARAVSVTEFGAKGDGVTDDSNAFRSALASGKTPVTVPAGNYLVGPDPISIPDETTLCGEGYSSCLVLAPGSKTVFLPGSHTTLKGLRFDGKNAAQGGAKDPGVVLVKHVQDVSIQDVTFNDTDRICVMLDNAEECTLRSSVFHNIAMALLIQRSSRVFFQDNRVMEARVHGVEIWGGTQIFGKRNSMWDERMCSDIIATGNYFLNAGGTVEKPGSPLWGTGVVRAIFSNNIMDGAEDVGPDLEWSTDSVISGNTVRNCGNAGISLFYSCERISITGNTIYNDHAISKEDAAAKKWIRSGIWLVPGRKAFPTDTGNSDVTITGNTITCAEGDRRAIWIGSGSKNIAMGYNTIRGGPIVGGGEATPMLLQPLPDNVVIKDMPVPSPSGHNGSN